jgi:hypothetical protein
MRKSDVVTMVRHRFEGAAFRFARRAKSNERRSAQPPHHQKNALRLKPNFLNPFNLIWVVQSLPQK